jgi:hypothetical protein
MEVKGANAPNIHRFRLPSKERLVAAIKGAMRTVTKIDFERTGFDTGQGG